MGHLFQLEAFILSLDYQCNDCTCKGKLRLEKGQNNLVAFATVDNLEMLCEAETIYINGTFKASPQLFRQMELNLSPLKSDRITEGLR